MPVEAVEKVRELPCRKKSATASSMQRRSSEGSDDGAIPSRGHAAEVDPGDFAAQILPGTFEHALSMLVDDDLDLSVFEGSFKNDDKGAPAYHPGVLLKIVLMGYSLGLVNSRAIEAACRQNIVFMALSGSVFSTTSVGVICGGRRITLA
jgi:hypothetical protein